MKTIEKLFSVVSERFRKNLIFWVLLIRKKSDFFETFQKQRKTIFLWFSQSKNTILMVKKIFRKVQTYYFDYFLKKIVISMIKTSPMIKFFHEKQVTQYTKMLFAVCTPTFILTTRARNNKKWVKKIDLSVLLFKNFGADVKE